ncbi:MAG: 30S ribosomal protein S3 [Candidatus Portnoybacteria bacterium]|jgi:small subunit ribosomal protein S3|nr:30S ribosomal protein S3 [Candidatus Portnoybacteria bacterium]
MGQKVNPIVFRLGITQNWRSNWFANKKRYKDFLQEDFYIREFLTGKTIKAGVERIEIDRNSSAVRITIFAARPGFIIGRGGSGIEDLRKSLKLFLRKKTKLPLKADLQLSVEEIKNSESRAAIIGRNIAEQIEKRIPFRRAMKQSLEKVAQMKGVTGVKIMIKGRLDGNEIARKEWLREGRIPLQTLRAKVDFANTTAFTTYGTIGIKVWVYKKEEDSKKEETGKNQEADLAKRDKKRVK